MDFIVENSLLDQYLKSTERGSKLNYITVKSQSLVRTRIEPEQGEEEEEGDWPEKYVEEEKYEDDDEEEERSEETPEEEPEIHKPDPGFGILHLLILIPLFRLFHAVVGFHAPLGPTIYYVRNLKRVDTVYGLMRRFQRLVCARNCVCALLLILTPVALPWSRRLFQIGVVLLMVAAILVCCWWLFWEWLTTQFLQIIARHKEAVRLAVVCHDVLLPFNISHDNYMSSVEKPFHFVPLEGPEIFYGEMYDTLSFLRTALKKRGVACFNDTSTYHGFDGWMAQLVHRKLGIEYPTMFSNHFAHDSVHRGSDGALKSKARDIDSLFVSCIICYCIFVVLSEGLVWRELFPRCYYLIRESVRLLRELRGPYADFTSRTQVIIELCPSLRPRHPMSRKFARELHHNTNLRTYVELPVALCLQTLWQIEPASEDHQKLCNNRRLLDVIEETICDVRAAQARVCDSLQTIHQKQQDTSQEPTMSNTDELPSCECFNELFQRKVFEVHPRFLFYDVQEKAANRAVISESVPLQSPYKSLWAELLKMYVQHPNESQPLSSGEVVNVALNDLVCSKMTGECSLINELKSTLTQE